MKFILLLLLFVRKSSAQTSCDTYCSCESGIVTCFNAPTFPTFYSTAWIASLILIDSGTNSLPINQQNFPMLRSLVLRNAYNIECSDILQVKNQRPELDIETDLHCDVTTELTSHSTQTTITTTRHSTHAASTSTPATLRPVTLRSTLTDITSTPQSTPATSGSTSTNMYSTQMTSTSTTNRPETDEQNWLLPFLISIVILVCLIIIILIAFKAYKRCVRDRVRPLELEMADFCYHNPVYNSTTV